MTTKQKLFSAIGGTTVCLAVGVGLSSWLSSRSIRKATVLQEKLFQAGSMSREERNDLKLDLMRTVDEMDREKVRELYDQLREQGEKRHQAEIQAFHAADEDEKVVLLDQALERWANVREVYSALRSDGVPRQGRRDRRKDGKGDGKNAEAKKRQLRSAEEKAAAVEKRRLRDEYYQALKARAEELGMGDKRRDGRRR